MIEGGVIDNFTRLYGGSLAQAMRMAGDAAAMPPWTQVTWLGEQVAKCPMDLWVYQEIIWETQPELIIETGTSGGGSAWFFANMLDQIGDGRVVTIDIEEYLFLRRKHPRIEYIVDNSIHADPARRIRDRANGKRTMVSLDSLHTYEHVRSELNCYARAVTPGCYLVVDDTSQGLGAERAVSEFLEAHPNFVADKSRERHLLTLNRGGWIRRER